MIYSTEHIRKMNVSREADQTFMRELERTDRPRYDRLVKAIQTGAFRQTRQVKVVTMPEPMCAHCGLVLPPELRTDARYCDRTCERNAKRARAAVKQSQIAA
jgi:hypothetical protein